MKRLILIGLLTLAPLAGCGSFLQSPTVQGAALSSTNTSVRQASTIKAAGDLYVLGTHAATAYLDSGKASRDIAEKMAVVEGQVYTALMNARQADKAGNSPAVAAALSVFNAHYAELARLVPGLS
jgi:hypothetical protein